MTNFDGSINGGSGCGWKKEIIKPYIWNEWWW